MASILSRRPDFLDLLAFSAAVIIVGTLALGEPVPPPPPAPIEYTPDIVRVHNDGGGSVEVFLKNIDTFRKAGSKIEISGICASACTLFLSLPDVCVHPDTLLKFHAPYFPLSASIFRYDNGFTAKFKARYPKPVQEFIKAHGGLTYDWIDLSGAELEALVPTC